MSKRKKKLSPQPITNPDITNTDPDYWEMVLESYGLGMGRGRSPAQVYVGDAQKLEDFEGWLFEKGTGKVEPPGYGPGLYTKNH